MIGKYRNELGSWYYRIFLGCLVVMLFHLTEDALVHKENGTSLAAHRARPA